VIIKENAGTINGKLEQFSFWR